MTQHELRRYVATRAFGASRLVRRVQPSIEHAESAARSGSYELATSHVRSALVACLSIRSLARGGEVDYHSDYVTFDPFEFVSDVEIDKAMTLINWTLDLSADELDEWREAVRQFVFDTELMLGFDDELPILRSPDGLFRLLALARDAVPVAQSLGMPPLLAPHWTTGLSNGGHNN